MAGQQGAGGAEEEVAVGGRLGGSTGALHQGEEPVHHRGGEEVITRSQRLVPGQVGRDLQGRGAVIGRTSSASDDTFVCVF